MYRIYLDHGEAYGNLGEEAMLINAVRRIREQIGDVQFVIPLKNGCPLPNIGNIITIPSPLQFITQINRFIFPNRLLKILDSRFYNPFPLLLKNKITKGDLFPFWKKFVSGLEKCNAVYCVGGANLNDYARSPNLLTKCILIEQAHIRGIPVVVSSQTVGPLKIEWAKQLVHNSINTASFFSLRDGGISKNLLISQGISPEKLFSGCDEAFSFPIASDNETTSFLKNQGVNSEKPFSLFHFRSTDFTKKTANFYLKLANMLDQVETKNQILFVPMSYWNHAGIDTECGLQIKQLMRFPEKLYVLNPIRDVKIVRKLVDMSQWVLSLSYHLQVFALSSTRPMGILSSGPYYEFKAKGMSMMVQDSVPLVDVCQNNLDVLIQAINKIEGDTAKMIKVFQDVRQTNLQVDLSSIKALARVL